MYYIVRTEYLLWKLFVVWLSADEGVDLKT